LRTIDSRRGTLTIGALATFTDLIRSSLVRRQVPMLAAAAREIGGAQIQNRGTIGGNVANASPAGDTLPVLAAADATVVLRSASGERRVPFTAYYTGYRASVKRPDELITAIEVPRISGTQWWRKVGDYATAAAAVVLTIAGGKVATCEIGLTNLHETPLLASDAAKAVIGTSLDAASLKKAAEAAKAIMSPAGDARGPVEYRKHVGGIMVMRALQRAAERAG